jgi:hypothetical protein
MVVKYITQANGRGWIDVIQTDIAKQIDYGIKQLPHYLKVDYISTKNNRDYFTALESLNWKGKQFSVTRKADGSSYLVDGQHLTSATVTINQKTSNLWYGSGASQVGPTPIIVEPSLRFPDGNYDFEIPDYPHSHTRIDEYLAQTPYAQVWFHIPFIRNGVDDARYLHCGGGSLGCVTVSKVDLSKWTNLYNYLFNHRKGDGFNVGTITVNSNYNG